MHTNESPIVRQGPQCAATCASILPYALVNEGTYAGTACRGRLLIFAMVQTLSWRKRAHVERTIWRGGAVGRTWPVAQPEPEARIEDCEAQTGMGGDVSWRTLPRFVWGAFPTLSAAESCGLHRLGLRLQLPLDCHPVLHHILTSDVILGGTI